MPLGPRSTLGGVCISSIRRRWRLQPRHLISGAAVWVPSGPDRKAILRTTAVILLFLAGYQIVEVGICSVAPGYGFLPRLAFMVVTWLPPIGIPLSAL